MHTVLRSVLVSVGVFALGMGQAFADLSYSPDSTLEDVRFIVVSGSFSYDDNLAEFSRLVRSYNASIVTFDSPGGNVAKAMEMGRLIRSLGMGTIQFRSMECSSACSLAFMGGVVRHAEAGSIGVHKSSYRDSSILSADQAVSHVQELTAEVMIYMNEMGVDPSLLQLSLRYDSDDIRYLSRSEMEQYRVVTSDATAASAQPRNPAPAPVPTRTPSPAFPPAPSSPTGQIAGGIGQGQLTIPVARSGRVRHPKGQAPIKTTADGKAADITILRNGTPLRILDSYDRWFRVQVGKLTGYMHHTWVYVDQFESGPFDRRHVQIKSYDNVYDAIRFAEASPLKLDVYLASNSWYAVTLQGTFEENFARDVLKALKERGDVPSDSFMTYANTYVRKLCCD